MKMFREILSLWDWVYIDIENRGAQQGEFS